MEKSISFSGYKSWKSVKENLDMFDIYILPTIILSYDDVFDNVEDYPYEIRIAWLFWKIHIYFRPNRKKYLKG